MSLYLVNHGFRSGDGSIMHTDFVTDYVEADSLEAAIAVWKQHYGGTNEEPREIKYVYGEPMKEENDAGADH